MGCKIVPSAQLDLRDDQRDKRFADRINAQIETFERKSSKDLR